MRFLVQGTLNPAAVEALVRHGHKVLFPADVKLPADAAPAAIIEGANESQLDIITADSRFVAFLTGAGAQFGRSVIYVQLEGDDVEQDDAIDRLFTRYRRLSPGRLYTVTGTRVKVRQLPQGPMKEHSHTPLR